MARLINPGPGEIADRLTILALKILFGTAAGRPIDHFERERNALLVSFRQADPTKFVEPLLELAAVNAALWHAEDDLREWREQAQAGGPLECVAARDVVRLAFQIQVLNDRRAELVAAINQRGGDPQAGQEKLV